MELVKNVKTNGHNTGTSGMDGHGSNQRGHARAGDAELIMRTTQRQRCCHVGGLLPYMIRTACSLSSRLMAALFGASATAGAAGAADSSTPVGALSLSLL